MNVDEKSDKWDAKNQVGPPPTNENEITPIILPHHSEIFHIL